MKTDLPRRVDLSKGRTPEEFYVPLLPDRFGIEAWRADEAGSHDYTKPHNSWCAITCLRMALMLEGMEPSTQEALFQEAVAAGVYRWNEDDKRKGWYGAHHRPFASYIRSHGFEARFLTKLNLDHLAYFLSRGYYCFPIVHPSIRYPQADVPETKRGHVVFCFGYDTDERGRVFRINNSGGFHSLNSQVDFPVPDARMLEVFSGEATIIQRRSR